MDVQKAGVVDEREQEIAELLRISIRTVHRHRENITSKLKIHNVADLVRYSIQKGYIDLGVR